MGRIPTGKDIIADHALASLALPPGFTRADGEKIYDTNPRWARIVSVRPEKCPKEKNATLRTLLLQVGFHIGIISTLLIVLSTDYLLITPGPLNMWMGGCMYIVSACVTDRRLLACAVLYGNL